jgi:thymidine kinase
LAKVYYRFGTMDSSKSLRCLADAHEYKQRDEFALLLKSVADTRSKQGMIESRAGLSAPCTDIARDFNLYAYVVETNREKEIACILIDEAQFLTMQQVIHLRMIADRLDIPVMCYGLRTDFRGLLFEGSQALFQYANRYEEIKTICREQGCRKKAMFNGRFKNGKPVFHGDVVAVGDTKENSDSYYYIPKCSKHFFKDFYEYQKGVQ